MDTSHCFETHEKVLLPPGFRFHPTDEELITHYLLRKVLDCNFTCIAIAEVDLNKSEPWELPEKAKIGERELYFFTLRDRKYPTGLRTNRATETGYWKATGKDKEIFSSKSCALVGMKKTLVFYMGRAPRGQKSGWVMHEYRLDGKFSYHYLSTSSKDEWVISRVFQKNVAGGGGGRKAKMVSTINSYPEVPSFPSSISLSPLLDSSATTTTTPASTCSFNSQQSTTTTAAFTTSEHVPCFSNYVVNPAVSSFPMPLFDSPSFAQFPGNIVNNTSTGFSYQGLHQPCFSTSPQPLASFHGGAVLNMPVVLEVEGGKPGNGSTHDPDFVWSY